MLKKLLISAAVMAIGGSPVFAGDITTPANYDWSGLYMGANGGFDWSKSDWVSVGGVNAHPSANGALIGGQLGYNFQFDNGFVLGGEAMLDWTNINGSGLFSTPGFSAQYSADYLGAARVRLGYGADRVLFYGTGGAALTNLKYNTITFGSGFSDSSVGWTVGAGLEYAVADHVIVGVQYDYYDFGNKTAQTGQLDSVPTNVSTTIQTVTARLSYKF